MSKQFKAPPGAHIARIAAVDRARERERRAEHVQEQEDSLSRGLLDADPRCEITPSALSVGADVDISPHSTEGVKRRAMRVRGSCLKMKTSF